MSHRREHEAGELRHPGAALVSRRDAASPGPAGRAARAPDRRRDQPGLRDGADRLRARPRRQAPLGLRRRGREHRGRLAEVVRVEALGEPRRTRAPRIAALVSLVRVAPAARECRRGAQLQHLRVRVAGERERFAEQASTARPRRRRRRAAARPGCGRPPSPQKTSSHGARSAQPSIHARPSCGRRARRWAPASPRRSSAPRCARPSPGRGHALEHGGDAFLGAPGWRARCRASRMPLPTHCARCCSLAERDRLVARASPSRGYSPATLMAAGREGERQRQAVGLPSSRAMRTPSALRGAPASG